MARYIDADKLPRNKGVLDTGFTGKMPIEFVYTEDIEKLPAADVVEVVRCKDCIYAFMTIDGKAAKYCDMFDSDNGVYFDKDFYCAHGERKEQT